jgi:hypothetical protein
MIAVEALHANLDLGSQMNRPSTPSQSASVEQLSTQEPAGLHDQPSSQCSSAVHVTHCSISG